MSDNIDIEEKQKLVLEELKKTYNSYRANLLMMTTDAPISVLCLPKRQENALINAGFHRIYDLFNVDLAEIKGISKVTARDLASRLDQFLSMNL